MKRFAFRIDYLGLQVYDIWNPLSRFVAVSFAFPLFLGIAGWMSMLGLLSVLFCALVAGVRYWDGSYFPDSGYKGTADVKSDHQNLSVADLVKLTEWPGTVLRRHCADKSAHTPTHTHTDRQSQTSISRSDPTIGMSRATTRTLTLTAIKQ